MTTYKKARIYITTPDCRDHIRETHIDAKRNIHDIRASPITRVIQMLEAHGYTPYKMLMDEENGGTIPRKETEYCDSVDTVPGFWNSNRDWLQFMADCQADWSWVKPLFLTEDEWLELWEMLYSGRLIMMVFQENGVAHG